MAEDLGPCQRLKCRTEEDILDFLATRSGLSAEVRQGLCRAQADLLLRSIFAAIHLLSVCDRLFGAQLWCRGWNCRCLQH